MDSKALAARLSKKYDTRDPFRLADEMGFIVVLAPLVDMRGFQQRVKRQNIIYINDGLDEQQQRLVCGHEMGHLHAPRYEPHFYEPQHPVRHAEI